MKRIMHIVNTKKVFAFLIPMLFVFKSYGQDYSIDKPVRFIPDTSVADVAIADINGDNKPDIIVTNPALRTLIVLINKCIAGKIDSASFTKTIIPIDGAQPSIAAITDADNDGKPDVFILSIKDRDERNRCKALTLLKNESENDRLKLSPVLFAGSNNKPDSTFYLKPDDTIVKLSDIDSDGKPELLILNSTGFISIYKPSYKKGKQFTCTLAQPLIIPVSGKPVTFSVVDLDNDKKPDIVAINKDSSFINVLHNKMKDVINTSSFESIKLYPGFQPLAITFTDIDADNKPYAIFTNANHDSMLFMKNISVPGKINATFTALPQLHIFTNYNNDVIMQDMNNDKRPELLSQDASLKYVYLYTNKSAWLQTGKDYFYQKKKLDVKTIPDCITDIDGDGTKDIIIGSYFGLDVYRGKPADIQPFLLQPAIAVVNHN